MILTNTTILTRGKSTKLIVLLHGWRKGPERLVDVQAAAEECDTDADILMPQYRASLLTNTDPCEIAMALCRLIAMRDQERRARGQQYSEVILVGHSYGALLIRKAYAIARGAVDDCRGTLPPAAQNWAERVSRIVLLAGLTRGWHIDTKPSHMHIARWIALRMLNVLRRWTRQGRLIAAAQRGTPFQVNLRIQWIRLAHSPEGLPLTVQLLGLVDDLVTEDDNVDLESGSSFVYFDVESTGHASIIDMGGADEVRRHRRDRFKEAMTAPAGAMRSDRKERLCPSHATDHVALIMHGIRDYGHWTTKLASSLKQVAAARNLNVEVETSSYGFFPMGGFLLHPERQRHVRWFMDRYTEQLARHPHATFLFAGHSNGTYLLASSLQRYAAARFDRAVFAGSVVPSGFPWRKHAARGTISSVLNFVATRDWVVAIFPRLFEMLQRKSDLGAAGHNGFLEEPVRQNEVHYVKGSHGAALDDRYHPAMVEFLLGSQPTIPGNLLGSRQNVLIVWASKLCPLVWAVIVIVLLAPMWVPVLLHSAGQWPAESWGSWWSLPVCWPLVLYWGLRYI